MRDIDTLCSIVFDGLESNYSDVSWSISRAILSTKKLEAHRSKRQSRLKGSRELEYIPDCGLRIKTRTRTVFDIPQSFLIALMEDHLYWNTEFILGKGLWSCLFAIRAFRKRRVRGLRYTVEQISSNLLHLNVAAGSHAGSRLTPPRVSCEPGHDKCFVQGIKRTQFPVRVCFGMKIKKGTRPNVRRQA